MYPQFRQINIVIAEITEAGLFRRKFQPKAYHWSTNSQRGGGPG
jgi:hypothetical protein